MNPDSIPFNGLIVGPTNSGKRRFVVDQLRGPIRGKFDYIVLICPTFAHNKTLFRFGENDPRVYVVICEQHEVEAWLKIVTFVFEGTNTLIILDDCAASKEVHLAFSARHIGISVCLLTQKYTSITASFRENIAAVVLFYNPSAKTTKSIFEEYAGDLPPEEYKSMISKLKERKFSFLVFSLRHPFGVQLFSNKKKLNITMDEIEQLAEGILNELEAEPSGRAEGGVMALAAGPNIPALREQLAVLVSTGKSKEAIGVQLSHEHLKRLTDKEVEKYAKRYEAYVGSKTTESLIDSFIFPTTKVVGSAVDIYDIKAYQKELREDYIINKELSSLAGSDALNFGKYLALANAALITAKHIDFTGQKDVLHDPVTIAEQIREQSSATAE